MSVWVTDDHCRSLRRVAMFSVVNSRRIGQRGRIGVDSESGGGPVERNRFQLGSVAELGPTPERRSEVSIACLWLESVIRGVPKHPKTAVSVLKWTLNIDRSQTSVHSGREEPAVFRGTAGTCRWRPTKPSKWVNQMGVRCKQGGL